MAQSIDSRWNPLNWGSGRVRPRLLSSALDCSKPSPALCHSIGRVVRHDSVASAWPGIQGKTVWRPLYLGYRLLAVWPFQKNINAASRTEHPEIGPRFNDKPNSDGTRVCHSHATRASSHLTLQLPVGRQGGATEAAED